MIELISIIFQAMLLAIGGTGLSLGNLILLLAVVVAVVLVTGFLIVNHNKKKWAFEKHDLIQQISSLKKQKENLERDVADLQQKLKLFENKKIEWEKERAKLLLKIQELEDKIQQLSNKKEPGKKDVIIEFFMNDNNE